MNDAIRYPDFSIPQPGQRQQVSPGVFWLRMTLPMKLDHINLWLLEDGDGWTLVDTGMGLVDTLEVWQTLIAEQLDGKPIHRVIVTHLHPDHIGCAGWLVDRFDATFCMTRAEYLLCRVLVADTGQPAPEVGVRFYRAAGFEQSAIERYQARFGGFGKVVQPLPQSYQRLRDDDQLSIGGNQWQVVVGTGHSPEHACLFCPELKLVISGDQILPKISSNVSVHPTEPDANPLANWLTSCEALQQRLPGDVLVLPAHGQPFHGAHQRLQALIAEHQDGLEKLRELCREPRRAVDVFPALFRSEIGKSNLLMATGEAIAHLHYLLANGELSAEEDGDGVRWFRAV